MEAAITVETRLGSEAFLEAVTDFLLAGFDFLLLGIATTVAASPDRFPEAQFFIVRSESAVVLVALRTSNEYRLLISRSAGDGVPALVDAFSAANDRAPTGLLGPSTSSGLAASLLAERYGQPPPTAGMAQRYLVAKTVCDPPQGIATGTMRASVDEDEPLLAQWCDAFQVDVGMDLAMRKPGAEQVKNFTGRLFVWCLEGGTTVAMAAFAGEPHPRGSQRVSLVYTPPEQRKKGYAGALVKALAAKLLAEGQPYIGICTDAANPTANKVYEAVGFEHVSDGQEWRFNAD